MFTRLLLILGMVTLIGCDSNESNQLSSDAVTQDPLITNSPLVDSSSVRDLDAIKLSGVLRVVSPRWDEYQFLPRQKTPSNYYRAMITSFAERNDLEIQWVYVDQFSELTSSLLGGQADVIVANMTITDARSQVIDFTVPVDHAEEWLVVAQSAEFEQVHDLALGSVVVPMNSSFSETLKKVAEPGWNIVEKASSASPQELVDDVIEGKYTATVVDGNVGEWLLTGLPVKSLGSLSKS